MRREFRRATPLEVQHYQEIVRRIAEYLDDRNPSDCQTQAELMSLVEKVELELSRFGYFSAGNWLMVEVDDPRFEYPSLTPDQKREAAIDMIYIWTILLGGGDKA